ncbi:hypothetical protein FRC03_002165 [Tulasnella sp. 419]|nr:hypothetical protein FRC03_002165 [Tulasnella sp. 419]
MSQLGISDSCIADHIIQIDLKVQSLWQEIAALHRRRNELTSAFRHLPEEIVVEVFRTCYADTVSPGNGDAVMALIQNLRLVCSSWDRLIRDTPWLWTYIEFGSQFYTADPLPLSWIHQGMRRSKNAALDVQVSFSSLGVRPRSNAENVQMMKDVILPALPRWRSCCLRYHDAWIDRYLDSLQRPAPLLEEFITLPTSYPEAVTYTVPNLSGDSAPRLRRLEIPNLVVKWNSSIFTNLTVLRITACNGSKPPLEGDYHLLLTRCSRLEELYLQGAEEHLEGPEVNFRSVIPMPKLRVLQLERLHHSASQSLLSSIRCDILTDIRLLKLAGNPVQESDQISVLTSLLQTICSFTLDGSEADRTIHGSYVIELSSSSVELSISAADLHLIATILTTLLPTLDCSKVKNLTLWWSDAFFQIVEILTITHFLERLSSVEVFTASHFKLWLAPLAYPGSRLEEPDSLCWLLPRLCDIDVEDYDDLLHLLQRRYGPLQTELELTGRTCDPRADLVAVRFSYELSREGRNLLSKFDADRRLRIAALVGENVLKWYNGRG